MHTWAGDKGYSATRHSVLFIDPQGEAFPLIGENTWAACRSRQEDLSCLDEFIGIILFHQSDVLKYGHLEQIALLNHECVLLFLSVKIPRPCGQ